MKYLEEKYYQRSDEWGDEVLLRLAGVRNNFVAADGRTHNDCKTKFHLSTREDDETLKEMDHGFLKVAKEVSSDRKKIGLLPNYINYILMKYGVKRETFSSIYIKFSEEKFLLAKVTYKTYFAENTQLQG